jgi:hypothetical protein
MNRLLLMVLCAIAVPVRADEAAILEKDFRTLMTWFPGVYDNQEQVYFEGEQGIEETLRHQRLHSVFAPVELPAFGEHVFYVQQHLNDDPDRIYQQRIYSFHLDYDQKAIRLIVHVPNDPATLKGAHNDTRLLNTLTPEQTTVLPGCDIVWQRKENQFVGHLRPDSCGYGPKGGDQRVTVTKDMLLTEEALWISEREYDSSGNLLTGHTTGEPVKSRKARRFECWMTVMQRDGEWTFRRGLEVHDQGGMVWLSTDEEDPQQAGIKMRNVNWPYGTNRPSLVLYAHRPGEARAVSYAWADPTAKRLGINLRWMQASCTHMPLAEKG